MNSIVIGSGFGGIAAALRLKAKGHQVKLIEKHPDLGGRARVFKKNGFIFDGGPTVITAPYLINELFELFKKDPKNYIELSPLKIWYQFIFEDKSKFNYSGDEDNMVKQIEDISKDDVEGYQKLVSFTKKIFDKGFTELADVIGWPTSSISNSILFKTPIFFKNNLNLSIPSFCPILTEPIFPDLIKICSAVKSFGILSSYSPIGLPAQ